MADEKSRNPQIYIWAVEWIVVLGQRIEEGVEIVLVAMGMMMISV